MPASGFVLLAFLKRIRAKQNKQRGNKNNPASTPSPLAIHAFICQRFSHFCSVPTCIHPSRGGRKWDREPGKETLPQSVSQSKSCLFSTFLCVVLVVDGRLWRVQLALIHTVLHLTPLIVAWLKMFINDNDQNNLNVTPRDCWNARGLPNSEG